MPTGFTQIVQFHELSPGFHRQRESTKLFEVIGVRRNSSIGVCRSVLVPCTTQNKQINLLAASRTLLKLLLLLHVLIQATVDSAYNIHGYKGQPVIVATKALPQNPHRTKILPDIRTIGYCGHLRPVPRKSDLIFRWGSYDLSFEVWELIKEQKYLIWFWWLERQKYLTWKILED